MALGEWIKQKGRELGFDRVGFAPATDLPELARFPEWLERGYAGKMDYMRNPRRADVRRLLPDARTVICCALNYDNRQPRSTEVPPHPERGWLSRYAWGDDYHRVMEEKLEALRAAIAEKVGNGPALSGAEGFEAKLYVDTGPVLERVYGKHAGLGWQGKNTCLLDEELGSFFFLGVLVTNLALEPDAPLPDGCGSCTLCLEACPTGALVAPYVLDARRCLSYLTIELRDSIPEEFRPALGRHVFGCDICQDVCPYNQRARVADAVTFQPRQLENRNSKLENRQGARATEHVPRSTEHEPAPPALSERSGDPELVEGSGAEGSEAEGSLFHPRLEWLASLSEEEFRQVFQDSAIKRAKYRGLLRNTLVAMGNSGHARFRPILEKFAASDDPLLAEHAQWALQQLIVKNR
ncbi:tRNA epoxyqueuosine(34) reductase QueG [Acidobacteriia bacterium AH_259_A11_L15]|nr:tRNA epoxyqueuosine(34) reductase QueG [Acidobacteriia bacterium AH_259_A11_L15]